ncbi:hypothetical protein OB2597_12563 [Pseudooceanicola batsensis HTCC2597]|uniref:Uncharacterized protein n=1 Tax=Pseudooceanicola batsensis (strain ATCC BAA-863 / DSM 15984 / KCTC 12145 / HTCC2597) TaxID=252305 RepID=A3TXU1_PSEBH|nr:hypothetical protein OB2597_12563 [Pseudooceanicola batsensis HTCC2597]
MSKYRVHGRPSRGVGSAVHRVEELAVRLGLFQLGDQEFDGIRRAHRVQDTPQDKGLLQIDLVDQKVLFPGARLEDVHRREDTLVRNLAVQDNLGVAGALELFEDHFVHPAARVDQSRRDDRQRPALFDIPRRAEEPLGSLQCVRINTTRQHLARGRHNRVECPTKSCDRVEKDNDISLVLDQTLGLLDHHLRDRHVPRRRFVECRGNHLALHRPLHVGHFLGSFVDQQDDQVAFRMIGLNRMGDVLQQDRLAGPRRCHDQRPLPLADRGHQVDDPGRAVLDGRILDLHLQTLVGIERRQVVEGHLVPRLLGLFEVDLGDRGQGKVPLVVVGLLHQPLDRIPRPQRILADHVGRDIDVVRARQIVRLGRPEKAEPVLKHLEHAVAADLPVLVRPLAQDLEHHFALAHGRGILDLELLGHGQQVLGALRLEVGKVQSVRCHGMLRQPARRARGLDRMGNRPARTGGLMRGSRDLRRSSQRVRT